MEKQARTLGNQSSPAHRTSIYQLYGRLLVGSVGRAHGGIRFR